MSIHTYICIYIYIYTHIYNASKCHAWCRSSIWGTHVTCHTYDSPRWRTLARAFATCVPHEGHMSTIYVPNEHLSHIRDTCHTYDSPRWRTLPRTFTKGTGSPKKSTESIWLKVSQYTFPDRQSYTHCKCRTISSNKDLPKIKNSKSCPVQFLKNVKFALYNFSQKKLYDMNVRHL